MPSTPRLNSATIRHCAASPVAVGGAAARGVVAAASYEARAFGVRSAMPSVTAKRKCPELIFVAPRFETYRAISAQIREIFAEHTDMIEPLSLDEAYLDVTLNKHGIEVATQVATMIRARIKEVTHLNASAGISYCKFLAKMASDLNKPNGQAVITPRMGPSFVEAPPVKKFHGVGPATAEKMHRLGSLNHGAKADGRFGKQDFVYDAGEDVYRCPAAEKLTWRYSNVEAGRKLHNYWTMKCAGCALKSKCTSAKERRVKRWEHEAVLDAMQERLDRAPKTIRIRRQTAEHPFGTIKAWMGATHFRLRTLEKVRTEMRLHILAYNLKRMIAILGVQPRIQAMRVA